MPNALLGQPSDTHRHSKTPTSLIKLPHKSPLIYTCTVCLPHTHTHTQTHTQHDAATCKTHPLPPALEDQGEGAVAHEIRGGVLVVQDDPRLLPATTAGLAVGETPPIRRHHWVRRCGRSWREREGESS